MKFRLILFCLLTVLFYSCQKDLQFDYYHDSIILDSVRLDTFILNNYYHDAKLLYCNEIYQDSTHLNRNNPILDTAEITRVLKIIQSIYSINSPETNIIFNNFKIHTRLSISFNSFYIKVQTNQPEIVNLANSKIPTGNQKLDNLISTFGFDSVKTFYGYPDFPWMTLYSRNEYNLIPIVNMFSKIPSIILTDMEKGAGIGDGNTITMTRFKNLARVIFSIGDGDCPSGCIYHKYWEFQVSDNKAKFIKSYEN
jgi:hypothetical protein